MKNLKKSLLLMLVSVIALSTYAQQSQKASPASKATGKIGEATVTISYSSPAVKDRKIWGALVPYNKIWRAGANEVTVFESDKALKVDGKELPAGKYSVYVLPTESEWTIIFNSQVGQWGITRAGETTNNPALDVLKVNVKPAKSKAFNERLVYEVNSKGFSLSWENTSAVVKMK